jgi:hypothetical protein
VDINFTCSIALKPQGSTTKAGRQKAGTIGRIELVALEGLMQEIAAALPKEIAT